MPHRITALPTREEPFLHTERDPSVVDSFLSDAAHVPGGFASGVAFPRTAHEVATFVKGADQVLPVGAQSSLTGGATPRGGLVLSTRALSGLGPVEPNAFSLGLPNHAHTVRAGAG